MKKQAKIFVSGLVLSVMALTGCNGNTDNNDAPNVSMPTSTATATVAPTASPKPTAQVTAPQEEADAINKDLVKANFINLTETMTGKNKDGVPYLDPTVTDAFAGYDTEDGARQMLTTYARVINTANLQEARSADAPADSTYLNIYEGKFDPTYLEELKIQMDTQAPWATADRDGSLKISNTQTFQSKIGWTHNFGVPALNAGTKDGIGAVLQVSIIDDFTMKTVEDVRIECQNEAKVSGYPVQNGADTVWLVAAIGGKTKSCKVVDEK